MKRLATRSRTRPPEPGGKGFVVGLLGRKKQVEALTNRDSLEGEAQLRDVVDRLIERLENQAGTAPQSVAVR